MSIINGQCVYCGNWVQNTTGKCYCPAARTERGELVSTDGPLYDAPYWPEALAERDRRIAELKVARDAALAHIAAGLEACNFRLTDLLQECRDVTTCDPVDILAERVRKALNGESK